MGDYELMPKEIEEVAERRLRNQPFGGIITVVQEPILRKLIPTCITYKGGKWYATRRIIDQLDQVTFSRIRKRD